MMAAVAGEMRLPSGERALCDEEIQVVAKRIIAQVRQSTGARLRKREQVAAMTITRARAAGAPGHVR